MPAVPAVPVADKTSLAGRLRGHHGLLIVSGCCVVAAALGLLAAGRAWVSFVVAEDPLPALQATASGHVVAAAVTPLALVVLAGVVAFAATRKAGRRAAGVLVGLAGLGLVSEALVVVASPGAAVAGRAARLAGNSATPATAVSVAGWPWLVVFAGGLALIAGTVAAIFSSDWPSMGRRYESGPTRAPRTTSAETSMWDRLDHDDDPTI